MKQFFKIMLASIAAMIVMGALFFFITFGIIGSLISSSESGKEIKIKDNSVMHIKFTEPIPDRTSENPFENFDFGKMQPSKQLGLDKILKTIEKAKTDDRIKGIYLDLNVVNGGMATVEEIRNALEDFKTTGKWIVSYSEIYTQKGYYLASVADKIYLNPAGMMELRGLSSQLMFFKNALAKLDVDMQVIRHGKFKSAVEPFMLEKMSESNRKQMQLILNTTWSSMLEKVAVSRNISIEKINELANGIKIQKAIDAKNEGFVDGIMYKDELLDMFKEKLEVATYEDLNFIELSKYLSMSKDPLKELKEKTDEPSANQIAVVYASGDIVSGKGDKGQMGSEIISKAIREARLDSNVKAIVLRVNSPGGSAMASDVMWREVVLAKKVKPVVVSMGNVAASGGYYISCAADKIVADEKTITGSIGVFGLIPNAQGFFNNKLGITFDTVKTNTHADMLTIFRPLTQEEKDIIQIGVENIYDDFITKVAEGRGMTKEQVDSIGQGRVWTGIDAKKIGLVDEIGGINKAIEIAQDLAKMEDYTLTAYPKAEKNPFNELLITLSGDMEAYFMKKQMGEGYKYYRAVERLSTQQGILARMPYEIEIH